MKIVANSGVELDEEVIASDISNQYFGKVMVRTLNSEVLCRSNMSFKLVEDTYKLQRGVPKTQLSLIS